MEPQPLRSKIYDQRCGCLEHSQLLRAVYWSPSGVGSDLGGGCQTGLVEVVRGDLGTSGLGPFLQGLQCVNCQDPHCSASSGKLLLKNVRFQRSNQRVPLHRLFSLVRTLEGWWEFAHLVYMYSVDLDHEGVL